MTEILHFGDLWNLLLFADVLISCVCRCCTGSVSVVVQVETSGLMGKGLLECQGIAHGQAL